MKHHDPSALTPKQAAAYLAPLPGARHPAEVQQLLPHLVRAGVLSAVKRGRNWTRYTTAELDRAKPSIVAHMRQSRKLNGVTK